VKSATPQRRPETAVTGVTAIVVNHDGGEQVERCLRHLQAQRPPLEAVIVIDSGSTDGSPEAIRRRFSEVRVIELEGNLGPSVARNRGLAEARTRHVLLVDDDVYLAPDAARVLLERLHAAAAVAAVPRLLLYPETDLIQLDGGDVHFVGTMVLTNARERAAVTHSVARPTGAFSTSCVLGDRRALLDAGGIDETFFIYLEDMELGLRLRSFGHRVVLEPAAIAWHDRGEGTPDLSYRDQGAYPRRRAFLTMRNRLQVVFLHYRVRTILVLAPALALYELATVVFAIRQGWLGAWSAAWRWQLSHARDLARRRRAIQQRRLLDDGQLLVGGPLPLAQGMLRSSLSRRAVAMLSKVLDGYWRFARRLVGWRPPQDFGSSDGGGVVDPTERDGQTPLSSAKVGVERS
jgi:GT2 family glycosyltransferase